MNTEMKTVLDAVLQAEAASDPLRSRDLLKFEAWAVRDLFDLNLISRATIRRGGVTEVGIFAALGAERSLVALEEATMPTPVACAGTKPAGESRTQKILNGFSEAEVDYVRKAFPTGTPFKEMAAHLDRPGGRILLVAHALGLSRTEGRRKQAPCGSCKVETFGGLESWRIRRHRRLLTDAASGNSGMEETQHRALQWSAARERMALTLNTLNPSRVLNRRPAVSQCGDRAALTAIVKTVASREKRGLLVGALHLSRYSSEDVLDAYRAGLIGVEPDPNEPSRKTVHLTRAGWRLENGGPVQQRQQGRSISGGCHACR